MLKQLFTIAKNRAKIQAIDFLLEILISTAQEFRRANKEGEFDVHNKSRINYDSSDLPERNRETLQSPTVPTQGTKTSLFNNIFK